MFTFISFKRSCIYFQLYCHIRIVRARNRQFSAGHFKALILRRSHWPKN